MALTETRPTTDSGTAVEPQRPAPSAIERLVGTGDHLSIGRSFIVASLLFGTLAALGLAVFGLDGATDNDLLGTASGSVWLSASAALVLAGALPLLLGLGMFVVPLQVGSKAIAFPRAAALSLWSWVVGAVIFGLSVCLQGGVGGTDTDASRLGNLALGVMMAGLGLGAVTVVTTVVTHRPVGMGLAKVPFFSWSWLVAGPIWIVSLGAAAGGVLLGQVSQLNAAGLAINHAQEIAWLWRAPSIYLVAIPVLGILADVTAKAAGRRIGQYGLVQGAIAAYGVLSFGAWAQTPRSMNNIIFIGWVIVAALPVLVVLGALADTLRRGRPAPSAAALAIPLSLLLVLGGVLAAALQAIDTTGTETLFGFNLAFLEPAQLFFLASAALLGGIGGVAFWSDKLWGSTKEGPFKGAVAAVLLGGGLLATVVGLQAVLMADSRDGLDSQLLGAAIAAGAALLALGVLSGLAGSLGSARAAAQGGAEHDETGLTLEWATASPPVTGNFTEPLPAITSPYPLLDLRDGGDGTEETK
jgi:heme/copper-type cytochrome/quinol oxidase subunit 1